MKTAFSEYNSMVASIPNDISSQVDMEMELSDRIYHLMTAHGLTKADFAHALGKRPNEVTKWLSG